MMCHHDTALRVELFTHNLADAELQRDRWIEAHPEQAFWGDVTPLRATETGFEFSACCECAGQWQVAQ